MYINKDLYFIIYTFYLHKLTIRNLLRINSILRIFTYLQYCVSV